MALIQSEAIEAVFDAAEKEAIIEKLTDGVRAPLVTGCVVGKASQTARQAGRGGSLESESGSDQPLVERIAGLAGCLAGCVVRPVGGTGGWPGAQTPP
jgi:hypothetical protein